MFKHLRDTDGACLKGEDYEHFCKNVRGTVKGVKVLLLYGYMAVPNQIRNGDDAATILLQAIQNRQNAAYGRKGSEEASSPPIKYNRSYGNSQRDLDGIAQDQDTGAVTEVLTTRLPPIQGKMTVDEWVDLVQQILNAEFSSDSHCPVQLFGRQDFPQAKNFNAEMDVSRRRVEYLLPVECISWNTPEYRSRLESLPPFSENHKHHRNFSNGSDTGNTDDATIIYLFQLKKMMQRLATQVVDLDMNDKEAVSEKSSILEKLSKSKKNNRLSKKPRKATKEEKSDEEGGPGMQVTEQHRLLKRKRFHNFTPTLMAHEYLTYRRLDRLYHRATLAFPSLDPLKKPFILLSMNGDMFLTGQVCRVVGVFLALANHLIDIDIVDCIFDESYPHLVPTPPAPIFGMVATEATYMSWEGKLQAILSARTTDRYETGWNQPNVLKRVQKWHKAIHENIAKQWLCRGRDEESGRLVAQKEWTEAVLLPWVEKAKRHLEDYRKWRQDQGAQPAQEAQACAEDTDANISISQGFFSSQDSIDATVPHAFEEVLRQLRRVDESGQWPSTTLKRQLVMISTADSEEGKEKAPTSLSVAHRQAHSNKYGRSSAYEFAEGQGGASGSFSVGVMPGGINRQPKSNFLFPELVKAAFELERVLCPNREPSSTIAINRNAQFRPHTDSGAGAGQSTSLIVGLGTYSGGELMVEGEKHDIRYKAIEFNGWKQRHWTMPFVGERYSLVWFTPKGCEGMRGIDLDLSEAARDGADAEVTGSSS